MKLPPVARASRRQEYGRVVQYGLYLGNTDISLGAYIDRDFL